MNAISAKSVSELFLSPTPCLVFPSVYAELQKKYIRAPYQDWLKVPAGISETEFCRPDEFIRRPSPIVLLEWRARRWEPFSDVPVDVLSPARAAGSSVSGFTRYTNGAQTRQCKIPICAICFATSRRAVRHDGCVDGSFGGMELISKSCVDDS